jgi:hypothetical protein
MQPGNPNQRLTVDVERFVDWCRFRNELSVKSEMIEKLKLSVGVTKRGEFNVRTRGEVFTMSTTKLHDYLGGIMLNYVNDEVVSENVAEFIQKNKKKLDLLKKT